MKSLNYESPSVEVIEIEIEDAILNLSEETDATTSFGLDQLNDNGYSIGR